MIQRSYQLIIRYGALMSTKLYPPIKHGWLENGPFISDFPESDLHSLDFPLPCLITRGYGYLQIIRAPGQVAVGGAYPASALGHSRVGTAQK